MGRLLAFVSDVHLDGAATERQRQFHSFLEWLAARAGPGESVELYCLGDLFQFWYEYRKQIFGIYAGDLDALALAAARGVRIHLVAGNRDFAYRGYMPQRMAARVHGDSATVEYAPGRCAYLCHGDLLCTHDRDYLRFRRFIRSWPVRWAFRLLPWFVAGPIIRRMIGISAHETARKPKDALKLDPKAADLILAKTGCDAVVCGHVHRFERTAIERGGKGAEMISLGSWLDGPSVLLCEDGTFRHWTGPFEARKAPAAGRKE